MIKFILWNGAVLSASGNVCIPSGLRNKTNCFILSPSIYHRNSVSLGYVCFLN